MRTEDDIRQALDVDLDHEALLRLTSMCNDLASTDPTQSVSPATPQARRRLLPLAAAAAVVLLVAGGVAIAYPKHDSQPSGGGISDESVLTPAQLRPFWDFAVSAVPGYTAARLSTSSHSGVKDSLTRITATSVRRPETGDVVSCTGGDHTCFKAPLVTRQRVTIGKRVGWYYPGQHVTQHGLIDKDYRQPWTAAYENNDFQPQLVWSAGHATTMVISGTFGFDPATYDYDNTAARKIMLRIASAVTVGRHDVATMPFALRPPPNHVAPEAVFLGHGQHCISYGTGPGPYLGDWDGTVMTACRVVTQTSRNATITAAGGIGASDASTVSVHDFPDGTSVVVAVDHGQQALISAAQARHLAVTADVSPTLSDPSTWTPVR